MREGDRGDVAKNELERHGVAGRDVHHVHAVVPAYGQRRRQSLVRAEARTLKFLKDHSVVRRRVDGGNARRLLDRMLQAGIGEEEGPKLADPDHHAEHDRGGERELDRAYAASVTPDWRIIVESSRLPRRKVGRPSACGAHRATRPVQPNGWET